MAKMEKMDWVQVEVTDKGLAAKVAAVYAAEAKVAEAKKAVELHFFTMPAVKAAGLVAETTALGYRFGKFAYAIRPLERVSNAKPKFQL